MAQKHTSPKQIADNLSNLINSDNFSGFSSEIQKNLIESVTVSKQIESGIMGRFLGTKTSNVAIYSALLLCGILLLFALIATLLSCILNTPLNLELIKIIVPVITMSLGYMFGKSNNTTRKDEE